MSTVQTNDTANALINQLTKLSVSVSNIATGSEATQQMMQDMLKAQAELAKSNAALQEQVKELKAKRSGKSGDDKATLGDMKATRDTSNIPHIGNNNRFFGHNLRSGVIKFDTCGLDEFSSKNYYPLFTQEFVDSMIHAKKAKDLGKSKGVVTKTQEEYARKTPDEQGAIALDRMWIVVKDSPEFRDKVDPKLKADFEEYKNLLKVKYPSLGAASDKVAKKTTAGAPGVVATTSDTIAADSAVQALLEGAII